MNENAWDERWREKSRDLCVPDPWLLRAVPLLPPGRALDVACGRGRNALFLAERGFVVHAVDYSQEAVAQLRREAAARHLAVTAEILDLDSYPPFPWAAFDLVLVFFYLQRSLFPALKRAVRPGGLLVVRTFSAAGPFPGSPGHREFVLAPGELLDLFSDWEILVHEEGLEPSRKGGSLAGIVARCPASSD